MAKKTPKKYLIKDQVILDEIYTLVKPTFDTKKLKLCIEKFVHKNHDSLYDYAPVDRI